MIVHFTPEQEHRIEAILLSGAYQTVEEVVVAALIAVEQRAALLIRRGEFDRNSGGRILGFGGSDDRYNAC